jgi:cytochrome P450
VEAELDSVLLGRAPRYEDLPQLPATLRAFKEAMRLYPPAFFIGRRALSDVQLGDLAVPKGTIVIANVYAIHHSARYFPEPERFDPSRFTKEGETALARCTYMPFGAGARMCIGNAFALMEGHLLLATWLAGARFSLLHPDQEAQLDPLITLRPKAPLQMRVEARAKAAQVA